MIAIAMVLSQISSYELLVGLLQAALHHLVLLRGQDYHPVHVYDDLLTIHEYDLLLYVRFYRIQIKTSYLRLLS